MTLLAAYDRARSALALALSTKDVGQVLASRAELDHLKLHARHIQDRALLADATEFQMRAERHLGALLAAAEAAGELAGKGRPKPVAEMVAGALPPATLKEIGVDRKLSASSRRAAAMSAVDFEHVVTDARDRVRGGRAITVDVAGSRAIMASRAEADDSLDYFPTPPWATRALIEKVFPQVGRRGDVGRQIAWEPACGEGHIAEVLSEYFAEVVASDIHDYGYGDHVIDFLICEQLARKDDADWIITNPPFAEKSEAFLLHALKLARVGVAMFVRLQWLETEGRYERIFSTTPPTLIAFFAERVNLCKGRWDPEGGTATAYIWLIWVKGAAPCAPFWIPPSCRESLKRPGDVERFTQHPVVKRTMVVAA